MSKAIPKVPWYDVYQKLAVEFQRFYKTHRNLAGEELFKLLNRSIIYREENRWLSNIRRINRPSLEPIQVFVSFSRSGQPDSNRIKIINEIWKRLSREKKQWNDIDFDGCPTPMALKLQYVRPENVQRKIWETFNELMTEGNRKLNQTTWDLAKSWRGIEIPSFTIFLFWINSKNFLPLDKNTRSYLVYKNLLPENSNVTFEMYRALLDDERIENYVQLALEAYLYNNEPSVFKERFENRSPYIEPISTSFRIIGIRILKRNKEVHKVLEPGIYYPFDNSIKPSEYPSSNKDKISKFNIVSDETDSLYNISGLKLNITAIVGKNGSGKSSLLDLLLMGIYNLSVQLQYLDEAENPLLPNLNFEIYWQGSTLYKLKLDTTVRLYKFRRIEVDAYELVDNPIPLERIKGKFFYGILVNYSHYSLNSNDYNQDWVTPLSHKNDGYKTPLVIAPKRTGGNIDINSEKSLLNMRLLLNFLEIHDPNLQNQSFRCIDENKFVRFFSLKYDSKKSERKRKELLELTGNNSDIIRLATGIIDDAFNLETSSSRIRFKDDIYIYLIHKLITICQRYDEYKLEFESPLKDLIFTYPKNNKKPLSALFRKIIAKIETDSSHITTKFKQALNYLKYPAIRKMILSGKKGGFPIDLDDYNEEIYAVLNDQEENKPLLFSELLPPSIFTIEFFLDDKDQSSLSKASSGEYQLISVLSNILYHIRNVDSLKTESRYAHIAVILDEIELYFHPNLQRLFIKKLMDALSKLQIEILGIHVLFSTHSPFILSDLKQDKILKLKKGLVKSAINNYNTFASNIHDLLADEFFLDDGYMGAFAKMQIEKLINMLNYLKASLELDDLKLKQLPKQQQAFATRKLKSEILQYKDALSHVKDFNVKSKFQPTELQRIQKNIRNLIDLIGEPIIKENLAAMYRSVFKTTLSDNDSVRNMAKDDIKRILRENNFTIEDIL